MTDSDTFEQMLSNLDAALQTIDNLSVKMDFLINLLNRDCYD